MTRAAPLACALLLAACSAGPPETGWERAGRFAENALRASVLLPPRRNEGAVLEPPESLMAPVQEAAPAEPALSVTHGTRQRVMRLIQSSGEQRLWRSDDGAVVATDGARVVATAGPAVWVAATRFDGPDPLDDPGALLGRTASSRRVVDLTGRRREPDGMRFGVALECRLRAERLPGTLLVEERCGGGARFLNRFWADPETGAVWRSEQWVGEERPMVLEVITPPAS